jgi:small subunit ribosomal protein S3Ae
MHMKVCMDFCCPFQVHGDYKEDVGTKVDRPADGDEVIPGAEEVAAAE